MGDLKKILISTIRPNPVALRGVDKESEAFLGLVGSIREKGFLGAITVRPQVDSETKQPYYELVDGLHRFTAACIVGLTEINADITDLNDDQVLEAQIVANVHKIETKPVEYTRQLMRILSRNPLMTSAELAAKILKTPAWLNERLSLNKINDESIAAAVNEGKISLSNAYGLAKLPEAEQAAFVDRAITQSPDQFLPAVKARIKEINEAKRKGAEAGVAEFQPVEFLQKLGDIKDARTNGLVTTLCKQENATTAEEGAIAALKWVLHVHSAGISEQKAKDEARKAEVAEAKKRQAAEREARKAEKAATIAVAAGA